MFDAFPNTPVNIDIKVNNDTLIKKVCFLCQCEFVFALNIVIFYPALYVFNGAASSQVSELVVKYDREHLTVWGNISNQVTKKCYKEVRFPQQQCHADV